MALVDTIAANGQQGAQATPVAEPTAPKDASDGGLIGAIPSQVQTPPTATPLHETIPTSPAMQSPSQRFFSTTDARGTSWGPSTELDTSGLPYLSYRPAGASATTTDLTRVDTSFDPRVAKPLTIQSFTTPRAVANRAAVKSAMGGTASDELDHAIALELAGSNNQANLRIEPMVAGSQNTATDPLENKLAKDVIAGNTSLFQAQWDLAKAKGTPLPYLGDVINKYENEAYTAKSAANYANSPLGLAENTIGAIGNTAKDLAGTLLSIGKSVVQHVGAALTNPLPTAEGVVQTGVIKPLAFTEGLGQGLLSLEDKAIDPAIAKLTGKTPTWGPQQGVFQQLSDMNESIARSPSEQQAYDTGKFFGWMVPYSGTSKLASSALEGLQATEYATKIAPLLPYVSDAVGFLGTGQILHSPDEGSRVTQLKNDAISLAIFDIGGWALKAGTVGIATQLRKLLPAPTIAEADAAMKPVVDSLKSGDPVSVDSLDHAVTQANGAIENATGMTPKELLQNHLGLTSNEPAATTLQLPFSTHEIQTPEREDLRNGIVNTLYGTGASAKEKRLDIVTGGPGAGKSTNIVKPLAEAHGSLIVDSDNAKQLLPEYNGGKGALEVHAESARINKDVMYRALGNGDNIVWPTVGKNADSLQRVIQAAKDKGYDVHLHHVEIAPEEAAARAASRTSAGGIALPAGFSEDATLQSNGVNAIMRTNEALSSQSRYSTEVPQGQNPILLERTGEAGNRIPEALQGLEQGADRTGSTRVRGAGNGGGSRAEAVAPPNLYRTIHEGGEIKMVEGTPVKIVDGVDTFIRKENGQWIVSEASTGRYIAESASRKGVLSKARFVIDTNGGAEGLRQRIEQYKLPLEQKPIELPELPNSSTVYGVAFPGAASISKFIQKDVIDRFGTVKEALSGIYQATKDLFGEPNVPHEKAAAVTGAAIQKMEQFASSAWSVASKRRDWWAQVPEETQLAFIHSMEQGSDVLSQTFEHMPNSIRATFYDLANEYRNRLDSTFEQEAAAGLEKNYVEEYFPHMWTEPDKAKQFFQAFVDSLGSQSYREAFGGFGKERTINLIQEGLDAGLRLVTTNPEELVLMREIDGFRATTKSTMMRELADAGLASPVRGRSSGGMPVVSGPDGKWWAVVPEAKKVLDNAFFSPSLWSNEGLAGKAFRTLMAVKGTVVPFQLSLSGFHPFHVQTIASATAMTESFMRVMKGELSAADGMAEMAKGLSMMHSASDLKTFWNVSKWWDTPLDKLEGEAKTTVQWLIDAGGSPKISEEFRVRGQDAFKKSLADENYIGAAIRGVPQAVELLQKPIFEYYVPALKVAAFMREASNAVEKTPTLMTDDLARKTAFREIWKTMDSRFGERVYKTDFWNPIMTQVGQATFLSLGWQVGFVDQFAGGALDLAKLGAKLATGKATQADVTSRMVFSVLYSLQAAMWGGLMNYAMTGKPPQNIQDLFYPQTGAVNPDGSPSRLNTPFYTREYFGLMNHIQKEGLVQGPVAMVKNKMSPVLNTLAEIYNNKDYYGYNIQDPNASPATRAAQLFQYVIENNFVPISLKGAGQASQVTGVKGEALSIAGFNPAPKYVSQTDTQTKIFALLDQRSAGTKPIESKAASDAKTNIRNLYAAGNIDGANQALDAAVQAGYISEKGKATFIKSLDLPGDVRAFQLLAKYPSDQEQLLSQMSEQDLARYAQYAASSVRGQLSSLSPTAAKFVKDLQDGTVQLVQFKAGRPVTP